VGGGGGGYPSPCRRHALDRGIPYLVRVRRRVNPSRRCRHPLDQGDPDLVRVKVGGYPQYYTSK